MYPYRLENSNRTATGRTTSIAGIVSAVLHVCVDMYTSAFQLRRAPVRPRAIVQAHWIRPQVPKEKQIENRGR
jgi:hypothetical protein